MEIVQEHSKTNVSLMFCGSAAGELLPPHVVFRAQNLYEEWTRGAPQGTMFSVSKSGWFDGPLFLQWMRDLFIPHIQGRTGQICLIGDNLAAHFSVEVVKLAVDNNIKFIFLPPNSTHLLQPLDVAVFRTVKLKWKTVLCNFRRESRRTGPIPKELFGIQLFQLWTQLNPTISKNLQSGFRTCGLHPLDAREPLKRVVGSKDYQESASSEIRQDLDKVLVEMLIDLRGTGEKKKLSRGKKVPPGRPLQIADVGNAPGPSGEKPTACNGPKTKTGHGRRRQWAAAITADTSSSDDDLQEDRCSICNCLYRTYRGSDWTQCIVCKDWVCGICTDGDYNPQYNCPNCE